MLLWGKSLAICINVPDTNTFLILSRASKKRFLSDNVDERPWPLYYTDIPRTKARNQGMQIEH
jgi:hypothetical protein